MLSWYSKRVVFCRTLGRDCGFVGPFRPRSVDAANLCTAGSNLRVKTSLVGWLAHVVSQVVRPGADQGAALVRRPQHVRRPARSPPAARAGSDLKRAFVAAMLEWIDAGWQLGEFSSTGGVLFCTRGVERRMVNITASDPGDLSSYGPAHLGRCAS